MVPEGFRSLSSWNLFPLTNNKTDTDKKQKWRNTQPRDYSPRRDRTLRVLLGHFWTVQGPRNDEKRKMMFHVLPVFSGISEPHTLSVHGEPLMFPSSVSGTTLYHPDFTVFPSTSSVWADFVVSSLVWFLSYRPLLLSFINPNLVTGPGAAFCTGFSGKSTQKQFPSPV